MELVIAEKPSVAQSIAAVLGATQRKDGYLEGNDYLVSWCVGHLVELVQPESYEEAWKKWSYESLPIIPQEWQHEVKSDTKTQYQILKKLMHDDRVDAVVCATDIEQQEGRILRQGNQNDKVKIFRYVTEGTFDSYSWQLIENKQKFIGQIMTSKSPVRSCEDVDEAALSYAEVKALATGNPYIKEKMDLDIQVSKLKLMKANHTSQKYRLEDNITQHYPHQIAIFKERIEGFTADMEKYAKNKPEDKEQFFMQVGGKPYTDKKEAGTAIIAMCKEIKGINASADVGEYLGFKLNVTFDSFNNKFVMNVKGAMSHPMEVGTDPLGNITRINNALEAMPIQLEEAQTKLSNVEHQLETAKAEVDKPFPQEAELSEKLERLAELNALLNMDEKGDDAIGMDDEATEPEKPHEDVKKVDNREEVVADMPIKQSNLEKAAPEGERRLADRPAERTSLQEKLAAMKARVSGTPAGRDAVDKAKGKDQIL